MIKKLVSGGQTGVDQAALSIASELGITIGGWCPKGGLDENGICILKKYPNLQEATTSSPDERTKLNIMDSDGTLIIVPSWPLPEKIKDGTTLTIEYVQQQKKPYLIINLSKIIESDLLVEWIKQNDINILNVAGPRESNAPGINEETCNLFRNLFDSIQPLKSTCFI